ARVGSNFTFTIRVTNNGSGTATDVTVRSSYSTYETISSANSTKGTTNTSASTRTVTGNIGNLAPGESATVTVVTRVSTSATSTVTLTNAATVTYRFSSNNFSRTSNSVTYRVTGSSTLPSTGFMEADPPDDGPAGTAAWIGGLLAVLGAGALLYSLYARKHNPYWTDWAVKTGAVLLIVGLVFGGVAWSLRPIPEAASLAQLLATPPEDYARAPYRPNNPPEAPVIDPQYPFPGGPDELESLPNFTIPTPTVIITPAAEGSAVKPPDTTAITRLVIPALGVDNIVKYVPYDGATWLISGLQDEIAWMGDTSWPGLGSNTALAGHVTLRDGSDGPFRNLKDLMAGDVVKVYTEENVYTYQVREQRIVNDYDLSAVSASEASQLTLITCSGWDSEIRLYISRLVVASDLVEVNPLDRAVLGN
ncbi:MAG TPA: sortase, partial [Anaerolineales bacterium]|nr:sortase [Anaerolineales bacterium]